MTDGTPTPGYKDFTHLEMRPDHTQLPTKPRGVGYDPHMTPQKAGRLLVKVATKMRMAAKPGKQGAKASPKSFSKGGVKIQVRK